MSTLTSLILLALATYIFWNVVVPMIDSVYTFFSSIDYRSKSTKAKQEVKRVISCADYYNLNRIHAIHIMNRELKNR